MSNMNRPAMVVTIGHKTVKLVSYWPKGDHGYGSCLIRHTANGDEAYIAACQKDDPSACVWMVPGSEG